MEFQRAVAPTCYSVHVCLHKDVVQCVINRLLSCPCDVVFVSGALRWVAAKKVTTPPSPKGQQPASRHTRHLLPTSWAPMQKRSPRPLVLSPFVFRGSRRQWVVSPRTRVSGTRDYCRATGPPCLQKFLDLFTEGNRPTRFYRTARDCCRATSPRVYQSSSKAGPLGTTSPTAIQISPFIEVKKLNCPSRHALRNQGTTPGTYEGNRPSCPHRSSSSAGG